MNSFIGRLKLLCIVVTSFTYTTQQTYAQCPTSSCTPAGSTSSSTINGGIFNVTLNTINNSSGGENTAGPYEDFACTVSTTLLAGTSNPISIQTGSSLPEEVRVWIDQNNNGTIDPSNELYTSSVATGTHNLVLYIPSTGITKNVPLRMRIGSDWSSSNTPDPCLNSFLGQTEDYAIYVVDNTYPPVANFSANSTTICNGASVTFTDLSTNVPTAWSWDFGDGNTSTSQNPTHVYSSTGSYDVTLIAFNSNGSDTVTFSNYITSTANIATVACVPGTASNAGNGANAGIYNVTLNTINNSTGGDVEGYQDYSCSISTDLFESVPYNISITTGSGTGLQEIVRVWADLDNDGTFTSSEQLFASTAQTNHSGNIIIPTGSVQDTILRMRVSSDLFTSATPTPCSTPDYSQVEDYGIRIIQNTNAPVADFESNKSTSCDGSFTFTDLSINGATAWTWDFGDGNTSNVQNPTHIYTNTGAYTVSLIASNANGVDTIIKPDYVYFHDTIPVSMTACTPVTNNYCCAYGILNFTFNDINNTTQDGIVGYEDFTCTIRTHVMEGQSYPVSITTGPVNNQTTKIWIDYNNDGAFNDTTELVFESIEH